MLASSQQLCGQIAPVSPSLHNLPPLSSIPPTSFHDSSPAKILATHDSSPAKILATDADLEALIVQPSAVDQAFTDMAQAWQSSPAAAPTLPTASRCAPGAVGLLKLGKKKKSVTWPADSDLEQVKLIDKAIYVDDPIDVTIVHRIRQILSFLVFLYPLAAWAVLAWLWCQSDDWIYVPLCAIPSFMPVVFVYAALLGHISDSTRLSAENDFPEEKHWVSTEERGISGADSVILRLAVWHTYGLGFLFLFWRPYSTINSSDWSVWLALIYCVVFYVAVQLLFLIVLPDSAQRIVWEACLEEDWMSSFEGGDNLNALMLY
ncbi:hypothetical protein FA95DRAFT_1679349 [Auriscalpium vulgare]|uniref:Uncharacterized protein n=1 Tax=Auriscalpium vulgare TaxID=40419 RepID=A0ACB8RSN1_9AGAM|nr:hypothetical protein FA95DRAFT_1679349 [Auriscalpium vulgare]